MVLFLGSGDGGKVLLAGLDDILRLNWDDGTVGVGDEASVAGGVDVGGDDGETGSGEVLSTGSLDSGLVDGDDGAVGVGDEASEGVGVWVAKSGVTGIGVSISISIGKAVGGEVGSLSGEDLGGLGRGNGAVGVGDELGAGDSDAGEENLKQRHI
jgi:hypothetical protein